jgi:hypothetical protein
LEDKMAIQQPQPVGWRARVRAWLQGVQYQQRVFNVDLRTAATSNQASFPKSVILLFMSQIVRSLAVWFVKTALRDAATELNINLSVAELDILSDIAVTALAA